MKDLITSRSKSLRPFSFATHWKTMLLLLVLCLGFNAQAQNLTVKGLVVDGTEEPMIGATVQVEGTKNLVVTDIDGNFTLKNVSPKATLSVSYIGYKTEKVAVNGQTEIKITLHEDSESLEEVVVIGYGSSRARRDLTGSVGSVSGAKLAQVPVSSAAVALQGKVAGVQVTTVDGQPGAEVNIRIRGTASVSAGDGSDSNPLYIVDGFQQDNINDIPPSDIQSIDILKDASLTAIYGAKGGNGVVVVTTKSAQEGKTTVTFNGSLSFSHITKQLDLMDSYNFVDYQYDRLIGTSTRSSEAKKFRFNFGHPYDLAMYQDMPTHDWQDEVMGNTPMSYSANVTIGGGTDKTRYNISITQSEDKGIIQSTGVRRTNINTKFNTKLSKTLTFTFNPKMSYRRDNGQGGSHVGTGGIIDVLKYRPTNGLREFGGWPEGIFDADSEAEFSYTNPVSDIQRNLYKKHSYSLTNQGSLEWKPISGLVLRTDFAYGLTFAQTDAFYAVGTSTAQSNRNLPVASINKSQNDKYTWTTTASYDWSINDKHNFYALLGYEIQHSQSKSTAMTNRYFPHDITADKALSMMGMGENSSATSSKSTPQRLQSYFGQVNYNYDHKYLLSLTARADGTSYYAKDNRWGYFPSVSGGWVISEEGFMKDQNVINNLKLRAAIGKSGKNLTKADMWNNIYSIASSGGPGFGESTVDGELYYTISSYLPNPDIKWETTLTRNVALDLSMFNNRLTITPEFYWNTTSDLLHRVTMLANTGYAYQWQNIGQITNKGVELTINGDILRGKDYVLSATFTLGANKMKVDKLNGTENEIGNTAPSYIKNYDMYRLRVGEQIGLIYGFQYDGIYSADEFYFNPRTGNTAEPRDGSDELHMPINGNGKTVIISNSVMGGSYVGDATLPGKVKFKDINGDGMITEADQTIIGNTTPKLQGGFSLNGQWKNFDLTANFTYFLDFDVYNATAQALSSSTKSNTTWHNVLAKFSNTRWRYTYRNDSENLYKNTYNITSEDYCNYNANATLWNPGDLVSAVPMDYFVEDGSFLRCTDLTVGYTLPKNLTSKASISRLRVYGSLGNLFTITNYSGFDPEVDVMSGLTPSFDYNRYPRSRSYVLGVNVTF